MAVVSIGRILSGFPSTYLLTTFDGEPLSFSEVVIPDGDNVSTYVSLRHAISPDGSHIAVRSGNDDDGWINLQSYPTLSHLQTTDFVGYSPSPAYFSDHMEWSPDNALVWLSGRDGSQWRLIDAATGALSALYGDSLSQTCPGKFSPDSTQLVTAVLVGGFTCGVRLFDVGTLAYSGSTYTAAAGQNCAFRDFAWSPDGTQIAVLFMVGSNEPYLDVISAPTMTLVDRVNLNRSWSPGNQNPLAVDWSPDGTAIVVSHADHQAFIGIEFYDAATLTILGVVGFGSAQERIDDVRYVPGTSVVAAIFRDEYSRALRLYDQDTQTLVETLLSASSSAYQLTYLSVGAGAPPSPPSVFWTNFRSSYEQIE